MGEFPSGQRGQTVNLLAMLSVVRIHLPPLDAQIAQLVEQRTENPRVAGSIPALGITQEAHSAKCFTYMRV